MIVFESSNASLFKFSNISQTKFGARCRAWNVAPFNAEATPCIAIRFEEILNFPSDLTTIADKKTVANLFTRNLDVKVTDLKMALQMSTVIGLADLAEDEIIAPHIPMNVDLENIKLDLIEDRPPVNITSPGPQPINLAIGRMNIKRDITGVFQIQPVEPTVIVENCVGGEDITWQRRERDREVLSMQLVMQQLKMDNDVLRVKVSSAERNVELNR